MSTEPQNIDRGGLADIINAAQRRVPWVDALSAADAVIAAGWVSPEEAKAREAAARREARRGYISRVRHEAALSTVRARLTIELHKAEEKIARVEALVDAAEKRSPIGARRDRGHPGEPAAVLVPTRDLRAALAEPERDEEGGND